MKMQLNQIELFNYGCFSNFIIQFESFNAIIGMNGIGKTTILNAIAQLKIGPLSSATKWKHAATNAIQKIKYYFNIFDSIENDNLIFMPGQYIVELTEKDVRLLLNEKINLKSSLDLLFYGDNDN